MDSGKAPEMVVTPDYPGGPVSSQGPHKREQEGQSQSWKKLRCGL